MQKRAFQRTIYLKFDGILLTPSSGKYRKNEKDKQSHCESKHVSIITTDNINSFAKIRTNQVQNKWSGTRRYFLFVFHFGNKDST